MGNQPVKDLFFAWLYDLISDKKARHGYIQLCRVLYEKRFRWSVPNDDNRLEDGLILRETFILEEDLDQDHLEVRYFLEQPCSVLEVLIGVAQRLNDTMYDLKDHANHTSRWFKELLDNLTLDKFIDNPEGNNEPLDPMADCEVEEILETFLGRTYDFHGNGGLFPLKKRPLKNQQLVEIWYQMMTYLAENYS